MWDVPTHRVRRAVLQTGDGAVCHQIPVSCTWATVEALWLWGPFRLQTSRIPEGSLKLSVEQLQAPYGTARPFFIQIQRRCQYRDREPIARMMSFNANSLKEATTLEDFIDHNRSILRCAVSTCCQAAMAEPSNLGRSLAAFSDHHPPLSLCQPCWVTGPRWWSTEEPAYWAHLPQSGRVLLWAITDHAAPSGHSVGCRNSRCWGEMWSYAFHGRSKGTWMDCQ